MITTRRGFISGLLASLAALPSLPMGRHRVEDGEGANLVDDMLSDVESTPGHQPESPLGQITITYTIEAPDAVPIEDIERALLQRKR